MPLTRCLLLGEGLQCEHRQFIIQYPIARTGRASPLIIMTVTLVINEKGGLGNADPVQTGVYSVGRQESGGGGGVQRRYPVTDRSRIWTKAVQTFITLWTGQCCTCGHCRIV